MDFLITFPNRFQFGLEKIFEIVIAFSEPNSIEKMLESRPEDALVKLVKLVNIVKLVKQWRLY